jgi:uncharacterized protein YhfF
MMHLSPEVTAPSTSALHAFREAAMAANPGLRLDDDNCEVRWIGLDAQSTLQIFELIRIGDKRGTFTLPWLVERTSRRPPAAGNYIVLIDMDGTPTLLLRVTEVREALFGQVTAADTEVDGSPVRDPAVWIPLHTQYWNAMLQPFGLSVSPEMPFWIEPFELIYDANGH